MTSPNSNWIERLSLDAVLVALLWGWALMWLAGREIDFPELGVLAMATWLTYVADRLLDTGPGRQTPNTGRHLYYKRHYSEFRTIWLAGFIVVVPAAYLMLPFWKFAGGWSLVAAIALYLWILGRCLDSSGRLLLKRTAVPVIFTLGTGWMAESWRTPEGLAASLVLLAGAFANVLLISLREAGDETAPAPAWLPATAMASVVVLGVVAVAAFHILWLVAVAALYGNIAYGVLLGRIRSGGLPLVRMWADAALADMALLVVILHYFFGGN